MTTVTQTQDQSKIGTWHGAWLLVRASWSTLKLDKELVVYPLLAGTYSIVWLALIFLLGAALFVVSGHDANVYFTADKFPLPDWVGYVGGLTSLIGLYLINNYYVAALVAAALHRFSGGDPSVTYGLERARTKIRPLIKFSLLQATIGWIFQTIDEKLSLAGRISARFIDLSWRLATVFAIPVIVMSDRELAPMEAIKESASLFKKTWAKNFMGGLTMSAIFVVIFLAWVALISLLVALAFATGIGSLAIIIVFLPLSIISLVFLSSIASALSSIFVAALYYYATTGQSPAEFDHNLLLAAFKPKPKWFV